MIRFFAISRGWIVAWLFFITIQPLIAELPHLIFTFSPLSWYAPRYTLRALLSSADTPILMATATAGRWPMSATLIAPPWSLHYATIGFSLSYITLFRVAANIHCRWYIVLLSFFCFTSASLPSLHMPCRFRHFFRHWLRHIAIFISHCHYALFAITLIITHYCCAAATHWCLRHSSPDYLPHCIFITTLHYFIITLHYWCRYYHYEYFPHSLIFRCQDVPRLLSCLSSHW